MEQLTCERLKENIARLKLARMNEVLDATVALAEREKMSYLSFLDRLFEEEVAAKEKRRVDMAMRLAGLPSAKTIEEYDFAFHPHLDRKTVVELFDLTFLAKHENVIFLGPPGVGKTHLAIALAVKACGHGFKVLYTTMDTLIARLKESQNKVRPYLTASLVVVDEAGYLPVTAQEAYLFFQFVSARYEKTSIIMTSNKSFIDWQELFGDQVIASAILDRLLHHCRVVNIKGHSYRLKGKMFAQQINQNQGGDAAAAQGS
jgi:DNA replication protein DnaC